MVRHSGQETEFRLLFVCTGNICRSPFAEILARHLLVGRLGGRKAAAFDVASAGVHAVAGSGMHPDSRAELAPWRLDGAAAESFVARQLCTSLVESSDLVLGVTPRHRSAIAVRAPTGLPITFGLREFARLAVSVDQRDLPLEPVPRAHALVELARGRRGLTPPTSLEADQVPDPMGKPPEAHHEAAMLIREAVQMIVGVISPPLRARQPS